LINVDAKEAGYSNNAWCSLRKKKDFFFDEVCPLYFYKKENTSKKQAYSP